ncbi:Uncharacterised protein [Candidatus Anstonella stagnisolia]|nr:Uncharacterised protein [Candidatus Anstonella stagnisolia]
MTQKNVEPAVKNPFPEAKLQVDTNNNSDSRKKQIVSASINELVQKGSFARKKADEFLAGEIGKGIQFTKEQLGEIKEKLTPIFIKLTLESGQAKAGEAIDRVKKDLIGILGNGRLLESERFLAAIGTTEGFISYVNFKLPGKSAQQGGLEVPAAARFFFNQVLGILPSFRDAKRNLEQGERIEYNAESGKVLFKKKDGAVVGEMGADKILDLLNRGANYLLKGATFMHDKENSALLLQMNGSTAIQIDIPTALGAFERYIPKGEISLVENGIRIKGKLTSNISFGENWILLTVQNPEGKEETYRMDIDFESKAAVIRADGVKIETIDLTPRQELASATQKNRK